jgi:hypothetical protein
MTNNYTNINKLPVFRNVMELTTSYIDIGNTFILPPICIIGIITSLICIIVLKNIKLGVNQYFYIASISDLIFSVTCFSIGFIRCGSFCSFGYSYIARIFELYVYTFLTNSCLLFSLLIDLLITIIKKLKSFSIKYRSMAKAFNINENKIQISIILAVSLSVNTIIFPLTREVNQFGYLITNDTFKQLY